MAAARRGLTGSESGALQETLRVHGQDRARQDKDERDA